MRFREKIVLCVFCSNQIICGPKTFVIVYYRKKFISIKKHLPFIHLFLEFLNFFGGSHKLMNFFQKHWGKKR